MGGALVTAELSPKSINHQGPKECEAGKTVDSLRALLSLEYG